MEIISSFEEDILQGFNDVSRKRERENPVLVNLVNGLNEIKKHALPQGGFNFEVVVGDGYGYTLGHIGLETSIIGPMQDIEVTRDGHVVLNRGEEPKTFENPTEDNIRDIVRQYAALALEAGQVVVPEENIASAPQKSPHALQ